MKYLITALSIFTAFICNGQIPKQGDNLKAEFNKIASPYYFAAPGFTNWAEGADMLLIGDKPNPNDCDFVFIALPDTTLIGIFTIKAPNTFVLDTEGKSILSSASAYFLLPLWIAKRNTKIVSSDKAILSILDNMYEKTLQANEPELDERTIQAYRQYQTNTTLANRHIALLFDNYQTIVAEAAAKGEKAPAEICIPLMKSLSEECVSLYSHIPVVVCIYPVVVCIYMGEALQSAGMTDKARDHFKLSLQFYPESIPLLVYNYKLEQDPARKKEQLAELKKKYPRHWMVQKL